MEEILQKINWVKKNNEIYKLRGEVNKRKSKMKLLEEGCREIIYNHNNKTEKILGEMDSKIQNLRRENLRLEKERDFYKNALDSMPKFIVKLFTKNKIMIEKGKE